MVDEVRVWEVVAGDVLKKVCRSKLDLEARIEKWIARDISVVLRKNYVRALNGLFARHLRIMRWCHPNGVFLFSLRLKTPSPYSPTS
jgi:hypothetical protein